MKIELQKRLINNHTEFFDLTRDKKKEKEKGFWIPLSDTIKLEEDGWYQILDILFTSIKKHTDTNRFPISDDGVFKIKSINKKKDGLSIRFYGGDYTIDGMIKLTEELSLKICEQCGSSKGAELSNKRSLVLCKHCKRRFKWKKIAQFAYLAFKIISKIILKKK